MNILFIYSLQKSIRSRYPLKGQEEIQMGISYISSVLKTQGHVTRLLVLDRRYGKSNYTALNKRMKEFSPELVCFTSVNTESGFIHEVALYVKENYPEVFLLLGGVQVTLNPDERLLAVYDALCIGEGEYPTLELAGRLERGEDFSDIKNLWGRRNGNLFRNPTRPFISDLNSLPFPDREMWQEWILEPSSRQAVLAGRGCPFNCTYCSNHRLRKVAEGKYVRLRSPENIIGELQLIIEKYSSSDIFLEAETLGTDPEWLQNLCTALHDFNFNRAEKATFGANLRLYDNMDFDLIFSNLGRAGFTSITIGLESGSERIRREVLGRNYSNQTVINAVNSARKYGIKAGLFNMIGLPGETPDDFAETLRLNQLLQPDWHATSIFFPYEGTELYEKVKEMQLLPENPDPVNERQRAVISYPGFTRKQIQKRFDNFHFDVYKKAPARSMLKLSLFFFQKQLGHNFMANSKNLLINILSRINVKTKRLLSIIQKI